MKGIAEALGDKLKEHDDLITAIDEKVHTHVCLFACLLGSQPQAQEA